MSQEIIVVSGLPRSGTSMMMRMLDAGGLPIVTDALRAADEDNPKGYFELEAVKGLGQSDDIKWLDDAPGKVIKIISPLLTALPKDAGYTYKVLFMRRHLREILASQAKMLERRGEHHDPSRDEVLFRHFVSHIDSIQAYLQKTSCFETEYFFFREMIGNPQEQAQRICEFLGKGMNQDDMASAVDKKLWRNRVDP